MASSSVCCRELLSQCFRAMRGPGDHPHSMDEGGRPREGGGRLALAPRAGGRREQLRETQGLSGEGE